MNENISWRQVNPTDFLASWDFDDGQEVTLKISKWEIGPPPSSPKKKGLILNFEGTEKKLFMNATNSKALHIATGSNKPSNWVGQTVVLYVEKDVRNPAGGANVSGLRLRVVE